MSIKIINDDCLNVMNDFDDNQFDLAIVDPPYGIGEYWMKQKHTSHYGSNDWNSSIPSKEYFQELFRVSKNQIIFGGNYFTHYLPITNSWIIWDKGNNVEKMNTSECELAWTSFKIPMRKVFVQWSGARKGDETGIKNIHPCQRPIKLHKWILDKYAEKGDNILDTHLGSGSIAIAAYNRGFDFVGIELDKEYYEAAMVRINNHMKQLRIF